VIGKLLLKPGDPKTAFKGKLGVRKSVAWTEPLPLQDIKTVGKVVGATLNDVLIATVTGALREYLKKQNSPVNELEMKVLVPVNIRKPGDEVNLGNKFSLVYLGLPVHVEDRMMRLKEVKRRMDELKRSPEPFVDYLLLNALGLVPTNMAKKGAHLFANKASAVLTNVPGPQIPLYFSGKQIKNLNFWVPRSGNISMGISIISYNGSVSLGLATDTGLVPDPESICESFEKEFNHLLQLVESGKIYKEPLVLHDRYREAQKSKGKSRNKPAENDLSSTERVCMGMTKKGKPCKNKALKHSDYCKIHSK
jgi:WS/DGAT/MGAT family acyltransferase